MRDRKVWPGGWRAAVLVLVGVLAGAMFLQPVGAHVNKKLKHLMKHLNPIYLNEGQAAGGDLDGVFPNPDIRADAVGSEEIDDNEVGTTELAANAVTSQDIADGAVGTEELADDAVTTAKIGNLAVGSGQLATNAVTPGKISSDAVASAQVQNDSLENEDIAANQIGSSELRDLTLVEASTAPFGAGQTAGNGSYVMEAITARCPGISNTAISGGARWDTGDDVAHELFISKSIWVGAGGGFGPGWRVKGGVDVDADFVLTAQVLCLGDG